MRKDLRELLKTGKSNLAKPVEQVEKPDSQKPKKTKRNFSETELKNLQKSLSGFKIDKSLQNPYLANEDYVEDYRDGVTSQTFSNVDVEELRAQNQPVSEKWLYGVGRTLAKAGTEFAKAAGYIGGVAPAILEQDITHITNNFVVDYLEGLNEEAKEALPVHVRNSVENGDFWRQAWSPEFYVTEGADAAGFMISALLSGGTTAALSRSAMLGTKIAQFVGKGATAANKIDMSVITGVQTFLEASAETKGMVDSLKQHWASKLTGQGYDSGKVDAEGNKIYYTKEQVDEMIGTAGVRTMAANSYLLAVPNMIQTKNLFGKGGIGSDILDSLDKTSAKTMQESFQKITPWKRYAKNIATNAPESMGAEAFQELSQFAIEDYESKKSKGLTNANWISGMAESFMEGLTTVEGQKSIFLGAIMGLGPGIVGAIKSTKADLEYAGDLTKLLNTNSEAFKADLTEIYKKNEDGSLLVKDGKLEIDPEKFKELVNSTAEETTLGALYNQAKLAGNISGAKQALADMSLRNLYPYLKVEGGLDIWKKHMESFSEIMENDYASLGFESKKQYSDYMTNIGNIANKEYTKVKEYGPAFYGINSKHLIDNNLLTAKEYGEELAKFKSKVEYQAVRHKVVKDNNNKMLSSINEEMAELKKLDDNQVLNVDESLSDTLEVGRELSAEYDALDNVKKQIIKINKVLDDNYNKLFDKKEQETAFAFQIRDIKKKKQEEQIEKNEVDVSNDQKTKTENQKSKEDQEFINTFYENLRNKGYNITEDNIKDSDFGKGTITLKDDEGNVYRVIRKFNPKTKVSDYFIVNYETEEQTPFTLDVLRDLGLNKPENIMSREDFKDWSTARQNLKKNTERLNILRNVTRRHFENRKKKKNKIQELQDSLIKYEESLEGWKQLDPNMSVDSVIEEIITLESKIDLVKNEIATIETEIADLNNALGLMGEMQNEILQSIENNTQFSFGIKLNEMKNQIEEGEWETDLTIVQDAIDWNTELSKELSDRLKPMQDALDSLYETIFKIQDIENILKGTKIPYYLQRLIMEVMPDVELDGNILQDLRPDQRYQLLNDPKIRLDVFKALKREKSQLMGAYMVTRDIVNEMKAEYKTIQEELKKLTTNKVLVTKYNKLVKGYDALQTVKFGKDIIKKYEPKQASNEQDDVAVDEEIIKKSNSKSTSSNIYKGKYVNGVFVADKDEAGNKVLNNNYKQGARWDEVAGSIPLDQLDNYGFRFVTNVQLTELGITPPSDKTDDLYAVLYDRATDKPVEHSDGNIIFTGVPFTETMFHNNGKTSINIERTPEYLPYKDVVIDENNTVIYNEEEFDDRADLIEAIKDRLKDEYDNFRTKVLEESKKETAEVKLYGISDISAGMPVYDNVKKKLTEVVDVAEVVVPNSDTMTKENNAQMEVIPGRVYVKTKSGQMVRAMNYKIMDLSDKQKGDMLNKIIGFIAMAKAIPDGNFRTAFKFAGKTNESIPFRGDEATAGVLDYFINWGISEDKPYGIDIFSIDNNPLSGYELRFKMENKSERLKLDELFDENGNVKDYTDLSILPLVSFLENKYLNVNNNALKKSKSVKIPKAFDSKSNTITYDVASTIDDYYLNNYLYTNIKKYDNEIDETPNFVNRYASYNTSELPEYKPKTKSGLGTTRNKTTTSTQPSKKSGLSSTKKTKSDTSFFGDNQAPLDMYNDSDQEFVSQDTSTMDSMFAQFNADAFNEKNKKKTTCETGGKQIKKLGSTRRKKK